MMSTLPPTLPNQQRYMTGYMIHQQHPQHQQIPRPPHLNPPTHNGHHQFATAAAAATLSPHHHHHGPHPAHQQQQQQQQVGFYAGNGGAGVPQNLANGPHIIGPHHHQFANGFLMGGFPQGSANGWTGVPLISTAASRRPTRKSVPAFTSQAESKDFDETAMSKLAIHAHGAPLILTGNGGNGAGGGRYNRGNNKNVATFPRRHFDNGKFTKLNPMDKYNTLDMDLQSNGSSSMVSGTSPTDTCLPRIIKPRKRRKKDRKPMPEGLEQLEGGTLNGNENLDLNKREPTKIETKGFSKTTNDGENELTNCSCRLCDPYSHIWAFPLRGSVPCKGDPFTKDRSCSIDNSNFMISSPTSNQSLLSGGSAVVAGDQGLSDLLNQKQQPQQQHQQIKDVGVIGGNRSNQQKRSEWRVSPPHQMQQQQHQQQQHQQSFLDKCDNVLLNSIYVDKNNNTSNCNDSGCNFDLITSGNNHMFGSSAPSISGSGLNELMMMRRNNNVDSDDDNNDDNDSRDSGCDLLLNGLDMFPLLDRVSKRCTSVVIGDRNAQNGANNSSDDHLDDEESILIKNLANLLSVSPSAENSDALNLNLMMTNDLGKNGNGDQLLFSESSNLSDSSGVSSASDTASVFSDCYSPIINSFGFPFQYNASPKFNNNQQMALNGYAEDTTKPMFFIPDKDREEEILNCLDMVWNRPPLSSVNLPNQLLLPFK